MFEPTTTGLGEADLLIDRSAWPVIVLVCENSEVLFVAFVAVAVTTWPGVTAVARFALKLPLPRPSVFTVVVPRDICPSPNPVGSPDTLE